MNLILTSDFPITTNEAVAERIRSASARPRMAWIPPATETGRAKLPEAQSRFEALGIAEVDFCDIDREVDSGQLARLSSYDVVYLSGGDPVVFRQNITQCGLPARLGECLAAGRLVVAASGGAMQFTPNVALFRLLNAEVESVLADRVRYSGMALVPYELLPHLNRMDAGFLTKVERYSASVPHDVLAIADGTAIVHDGDRTYRCHGSGVRFRSGTRSPI